MNLFKISLKIESPLVTSLKSDTIWGHFVWGIANHEGDKAVEEFLDECKSKTPPLIVSSAFPQGTICRPIPAVTEHKKLSIEDYSQIKKNKKIKFVSASDYFENINGNIIANSVYVEASSTHNSINRYTNTVEEGGLYSVKETWVTSYCSVFDLYILTKYDAARVNQLAQWAFENGYGADASTGKGVIRVCSDAEIVKPSKQTNKYVALGTFVSDGEIENLKADIFVRTGKIGGSFVSSLSPYKKTVVLFDEGAVFESKKSVQFVGKLITDVHSDKRICQSGFAPVIPIPENGE